MIAGRYTRDREIGRGGMGVVWLGRDEVLGRPVAIKRVGSVGSEAGADVERAEREAKIAASLSHPHIVGIFDLVAEDGEQWMIMEYVEGTTLSGLVRTQGPLTPDQARPILAQAASALAAAHAIGIVHRDVKPSNILVREDGQVKLTDFGIARGQTDAALTQTGLLTGSPAYIAPEIASGQLATSASDVWSLGATLFHALAGHPPYDASDNVLGALYRIVHEPPPRLDDAGPLAPLLEATMVRAPEERWSMDDITAFLHTGDVPRPASPTAPVPAPTALLPHQTEPDATETLQVGAAAAPAASPPAATGPVPGPSTGSGDAPSRRRRGLLPALISLLVVALVVAIVLLAQQDDPTENLAQPGDTPSASASTSPTSPSSTTTSPTETPSSSPTPDVPTQRELRGFIDSYLSLASSDPTSAFSLLTPAFQQQSPAYDDFWGNVSNPRVLSFSADPEALTISYTYRYQFRGSGQREESVQLQLVETDDGFLIDGEA